MAQVCGLALGVNGTAETLSFQCRRACQPVLPLYWEKSQSPFRQLSNGDNRATPSTSSGTQQGIVCRARLHLRLLTHGLAHMAITSAGHFPASQARPAFQPVGSPRFRDRQRPPRYTLDPASRRAGNGNTAPAARLELAAPSTGPRRPPLPRVAPDSGLTMAAALPRGNRL